MTKETFSDLASMVGATAAINGIVAEIEQAFDNTLSRDGSAPNQMTASIDMNSNRVLNLPYPSSNSEPVRYGDTQLPAIDAQVAAAAASAASALASKNAAQTAQGLAEDAQASAEAASALNVLNYGVTNDGVNCQTAMNALMADTTKKALRFPAGIYRANMDNTVGGRTLIFDEGAIIDGTVHIAIGRGPDTNGDPSITWNENTRVIGTVTSTVRVGTYYCKKVHIDKIRITEIDAAYTNQTANGGSSGVHLYVGSKDIFINEIICDSATTSAYAVSVDRAVTIDADSKPENVYIGRVIIRDNTQAVFTTNDTVNLHVGEIIAYSWDTYNALAFTADTNLRIDKITAIGSPITAGRDGIYVLNGVSASFGEVEISGSTQIGFRTFNCGRVDADKITSYGNALDQVRIESPGRIGLIKTSSGGTGKAVSIQGAATGLFVDEVKDDGGGGVTVISDDVTIKQVTSKNNASKYGLELNGADRFINDYLMSDGNDQGLRMTTVVDPTLGDLYIYNNTYGTVLTSVSGLSYKTVKYSGNVTYDTNQELNSVTGFKGSLVRSSLGFLSDADATIVVGTNQVTQVLKVPITADRTVTLSATGAQNGNKFRVTRTATATGAFNLIVTNILNVVSINLGIGEWADFEYLSGWYLTGKGTL